MEAFTALLAVCEGNSPVPGEFPTQRPVTRIFDVFFDLRLNKRLSKQSPMLTLDWFNLILMSYDMIIYIYVCTYMYIYIYWHCPRFNSLQNL